MSVMLHIVLSSTSQLTMGGPKDIPGCPYIRGDNGIDHDDMHSLMYISCQLLSTIHFVVPTRMVLRFLYNNSFYF